MFNKQIKLILVFIGMVCIYLQPVSAIDNHKQMNATLVSDLNQTVGKDIKGLMMANQIEIFGNTWPFQIQWSPNGDHLLINVLQHGDPEGKYTLGFISAIYVANADGSGVTRIVWGERILKGGGKEVNSPVWSASGDYFAYKELLLSNGYSVTSSDICIISNNLELIQKIKCDPKYRDYDEPEWSPQENKIAAIMPGCRIIAIYDADERNESYFEIPDDVEAVDDLEWSPDGQKIAFSINGKEIDDRGLLLLDIEQGDFYQVYFGEFDGVPGQIWSPDSKRLVCDETKESEDGEFSYDVYVMKEGQDEPAKIITFNTVGSRVLDWYPDSERLLVEMSSDPHELSSLSITGELDKQIEGDQTLTGMVGSNGYVSATVRTGSRFPPRSEIYDLFLLNESDKLTIENVTYYTWKGADLLFVKDDNILMLNTTTHDVWNITVPVRDSDKISLDQSGRFIAVGNKLFELHGQGLPLTTAGNYTNTTVSEVMVLNNETDFHSNVSTKKETSSTLPGFSAVIAFMVVLIAFAGASRKE